MKTLQTYIKETEFSPLDKKIWKWNTKIFPQRELNYFINIDEKTGRLEICINGTKKGIWNEWDSPKIDQSILDLYREIIADIQPVMGKTPLHISYVYFCAWTDLDFSGVPLGDYSIHEYNPAYYSEDGIGFVTNKNNITISNLSFISQPKSGEVRTIRCRNKMGPAMFVNCDWGNCEITWNCNTPLPKFRNCNMNLKRIDIEESELSKKFYNSKFYKDNFGGVDGRPTEPDTPVLKGIINEIGNPGVKIEDFIFIHHKWSWLTQDFGMYIFNPKTKLVKTGKYSPEYSCKPIEMKDCLVSPHDASLNKVRGWK